MGRTKPRLQLHKTTMHAISILLDRAQAGDELASTGEIAERIGISQQHVFKIVALLAKARLVTCERGRKGGVRLARPTTEITLGDVVRALESKSRSESLGNWEIGEDPILRRAVDAFVSVLDRHTVAGMASKSLGGTSIKRPPAARDVRRRRPPLVSRGEE